MSVIDLLRRQNRSNGLRTSNYAVFQMLPIVKIFRVMNVLFNSRISDDLCIVLSLVKVVKTALCWDFLNVEFVKNVVLATFGCF